jgi:hypothetical protein
MIRSMRPLEAVYTNTRFNGKDVATDPTNWGEILRLKGTVV